MVVTPTKPGTVKVPAFPLWQRAVLFGVAYWVCAQVSQYLAFPLAPQFALWLPAGLYAAALLLNQTRVWLAFMLAAFLAHAVFDLSHHYSIAAFFGFYCASTIGAVVGAWLMRRFVAERPALETLKEFLGFLVFVCGIGAVTGVLIGAAIMAWTGFHHPFSGAMATMLITPFVLVWFRHPRPAPSSWSVRKIIEVIVLLAVLTWYAWFMFVEDAGISVPYKSRLMPFLLWAGLRFGMRGATAINLWLALWVTFLTSHYMKGLSDEQVISGSCMNVLQSFLSMSTLIAIVPAIVLAQRDKNLRQLKDSEKRFRNLTDAAFEGIVISENGTIVDVNEQSLKMFACRREEMIGREIQQFAAPECRAAVSEAIRTEREVACEQSLLRPDGTTFYAETRAKMVPLGDRVLRMTAIRDISERKKTEQALRSSEERFRLLWNQSADGARLTNAAGMVILANPAYCQLVRLPVESVQEHLMCDVYLSGKRTEILANHRANFASRSVKPRVETQVTLWNGETLWLDVSNTFLERVGNEPLLLALFRDITERKRADLELLTEKALSDSVINGLPGIFYMFDTQGALLRWNEEFARVLGGPPGQLPSHKLLACIVEEDLPKARAAVERAYSEGVMSVEAGMNTERGVRHFHFVARRLQVGDDVFLVGTGYDITEQKQMETQLFRSQRQQTIGTLASGVAHDLNNILSPLLIGLPILREEIEKKDIRQLLDLMESSLLRGADIVKQLLIFGRGGQSQRLPMNPVRQIQEVAKIVNQTFPKNIRLETSWPESPWSISADPTQIYQVLLNLAVNARDAMPQGGTLAIAAENITLDETQSSFSPRAKAGNYVALRVRDTGIGMTSEVLDRIFEPFFTTKEFGKGTGLGLAVVIGVVENHGGFLDVQSKVGQGTEFKIYLPALPSIAEPKETTTRTVLPHGHGELILVVDDEPAILKVTAKILEKHGYQTLAVSNATDALKTYNENSQTIKAVISDLSMPGMDGLQLAAALLNTHPEANIIIASGLGDNLDAARLKAFGIKHLLKKPYGTEEVLDVLSQILSGKEDNAT